MVLYAIVDDCDDPEPVIARLRAYAEARDWVVSEGAVLIDIGSATRHRRERPNWFKASALLREGAVEGLIAPSLSQIAHGPVERDEFLAWLATLAKFAIYLDGSDASGLTDCDASQVES
ncbi:MULTISPECIES: hypothetical protein [Streptomyces]|uniref:hypothetical protein n=1 Tax=Streptomyces TaxID=1883 RepID=UPI002271F175|nr:MULTISPECIES: hypothetical protein [unclassified Streptomyces]MCY0923290.1 hypothetical protein [Streptomyces sp. H27-G5]MCY0943967.1 hypothetical protein [Streptomyces sp. H34-AA3]MCY0956313.1 hypothetical protein [Streptomyces sp. H27-H5]MCZ4082333.1 hypothetical protein [Streptomyces sp. H34-S5]